jgi:hypothetical protein
VFSGRTPPRPPAHNGVASCGASTDTEHDEVQDLDLTTGKVKWTQKYDKGWRVARTYSVDTLVVYSTNEDGVSASAATPRSAAGPSVHGRGVRQ